MKQTKRILGLALAAVMCMGMLAGCGGTKSNSDAADTTSGTETSEKVLNIATIGETTTLSPLYMIADNRPTQKLLYEGLVKYVDGEIKPVLAEDWKLSEDGTQLTFYLRKGVTFHDGEPFNAEAAIANIEAWHINPFDLLSTTPEQSAIHLFNKNGGESGIRTHGALPHGSFQDCFLKPLGHLSLWTPALRRVECLFNLPDLCPSVKPLPQIFLPSRKCPNLPQPFWVKVWKSPLQKHLFVV